MVDFFLIGTLKRWDIFSFYLPVNNLFLLLKTGFIYFRNILISSATRIITSSSIVVGGERDDVLLIIKEEEPR